MLNSKRPQLSGRAGLAGLLALAPIAGLYSWNPPQDPDPGLDDARLALEQLYETRRLISQEDNDWKVGSELLGDQIDLTRRELASLSEQIKTKEGESTEAQRLVAELDAASVEGAEASEAMVARVVDWERRLRVLVPRLPVPLQEELRSMAQSLPKADEKTKLTASKRVLTVVYLLTQINKFHGEIHTASEVLEVQGGGQSEMRTLYLGISQGYYVSANGEHAGVGQSSESGWDWTPSPDAAAEIAKAIDILAGDTPADYAALPVRIQ